MLTPSDEARRDAPSGHAPAKARAACRWPSPSVAKPNRSPWSPATGAIFADAGRDLPGLPVDLDRDREPIGIEAPGWIVIACNPNCLKRKLGRIHVCRRRQLTEEKQPVGT